MGWDPDQYLQYADQRLRPALDLLARVPLREAHTIFDLGCGPGTISPYIRSAFAGADIEGVDSSPKMLEAAQQHNEPDITWVQADIASWQPQISADLIYSNAALQWLDDHEHLFARLMGFVTPGGVLAVQMPNQFDQPSHVLMREVAGTGPWASFLKPHLRAAPVAKPASYFAWLSSMCSNVDIWQTQYSHVLTGPDPVLNWMSSTALNPLYEALSDDLRPDFQAALAEKLRAAYPQTEHGTTLFGFTRLFVVATKA